MVAANGVKVAVFVTEGPPDDLPPVVLLHGVPQDHRIWDGVLTALGGRTVYRLDLPGLGASGPAPAYDVAAITGVLLDVIDQLPRTGRVDVVGHDWGGVFAMALCSAAPGRVRRLVVANAPGEKISMLRAAHLPFFALPGLPERVVNERFVRFLLSAGWKSPGRSHDPELVDRWAKAYAETGQLSAMLGYYRAAVRPRAKAMVRKPAVTLPPPRFSAEKALVIWGADDPVLPLFVGEAVVKQLGRSLPPAEVTMSVIPGAGHYVIEEASAEVAAVLVPFLA